MRASPQTNTPINMEEEKKEIKALTDEEKRAMEESAIDILLQFGVSFGVPLRKEEIASLQHKKSLLNKLLHRQPKIALPRELDIKTRKLPNPANPEETIDYYEAEVNIRPMCLATICAIRRIRLEIEQKDPKFKEKLESEDIYDWSIYDHMDMVLKALAIATLNTDDTRTYAKEIEEWMLFYRRHLVNQRLAKLVQVIMTLTDTKSFRISTRLILGLGTTAPREASRVESPQSKA